MERILRERRSCACQAIVYVHALSRIVLNYYLFELGLNLFVLPCVQCYDSKRSTACRMQMATGQTRLQAAGDDSLNNLHLVRTGASLYVINQLVDAY